MIGALVLAAGRSARFGSDKRMAKTAGGKSMLETTLSHYVSCFADVKLVIRHDDLAGELLSEDALQRVGIVHADPTPIGMGASIAAGVRQSAKWSSICIALADMPWVRRETLHRIIDAWNSIEDPTSTVLYPVHAGTTGHPVIFDSSLFKELRSLDGEAGAAKVKALARRRLCVSVDDSGTLRDVDRPDDLRI